MKGNLILFRFCGPMDKDMRDSGSLILLWWCERKKKFNFRFHRNDRPVETAFRL